MKKITLLLGVLFLLIGCGGSKEDKGGSEDKVIKVGATPVPHAEVLGQVKDILKEKGYDLQIVEFTDYVTPNLSLDSGELDANYFQHKPYLDAFNEDRKLDLVEAGKVHVEPIGLYSNKYESLDSFPTTATIAIPNDPSNGGRALILLEEKGWIKLKEGSGLKATENDVIPVEGRNITFKAIEAAQLPRILDDVDGAIINGNYAIQAKLNPIKDALILEDANSPYANIIAVKKGNEATAKTKALVEALHSDKVRKFILDSYDGGVVPAF